MVWRVVTASNSPTVPGNHSSSRGQKTSTRRPSALSPRTVSSAPTWPVPRARAAAFASMHIVSAASDCAAGVLRERVGVAWHMRHRPHVVDDGAACLIVTVALPSCDRRSTVPEAAAPAAPPCCASNRRLASLMPASNCARRCGCASMRLASRCPTTMSRYSAYGSTCRSVVRFHLASMPSRTAARGSRNAGGLGAAAAMASATGRGKMSAGM
mmetsp:Transcript_34504/g.87060  ORF Transcript_34504/g.87060 Transcript_34504/m.87060 type:complete len:213 (-) Transcript_34504:126-764(-)